MAAALRGQGLGALPPPVYKVKDGVVMRWWNYMGAGLLLYAVYLLSWESQVAAGVLVWCVAAIVLMLWKNIKW